MKLIKAIAGVLTSPELIRLFDKNDDGVISLDELMNSTRAERLKAISFIVSDIAIKYGGYAILAFL